MNIHNHIYKHSLLVLISISSLILWSCGSDESDNTAEYDGKNLYVNFATPSALTGSPIDNLQAYIQLNDGSPIDLEVNPNNSISGTIHDVAVGQYTLFIVYYVMESGLETQLATIAKDIVVADGEVTRVEIADADLNRNIDDDNDGYTNLAEVRIGTSAHNKAELPGGRELPLFAVGNGSFGDISSVAYESQGIVGEGLNGTASSTSHKIVSGFSNY